MRTEILDGDGIIREATASGSVKNSYATYCILNNAPDFDSSSVMSQNKASGYLLHSGWGCSQSYPRQMLTLCPNSNWTSNSNQGLRTAKDIRMEDSNEVLHWMQGTVNNYGIWNSPTGSSETPYAGTNTSDLTADAYAKITAYDENGTILRTAKLYDWNSNLRPKETINGCSGVWPRTHNRYCTQNVSPVFINANCIHDSSSTKKIWEDGGQTYTRRRIDVDGAPRNQQALFLNDEVAYYCISGIIISTTCGFGTGAERSNFWEFRWYKIDRDREGRTVQSITSTTDSTRYAGIYYTALRTDATTLAYPVSNRGFRYNYETNPIYRRIYWLNKMGGIDCHTFKGNCTTSYSTTRDLILKREPNLTDVGYGFGSSTWPSYYGGNNISTNGIYNSDSYRGGDVYEGGREVLNVDSIKMGTVTSLPLHSGKAEWLREIISSPNVWTEYWMIDQRVHANWTMGLTGNRSLSNIRGGAGGYMGDGRHPTNFQYSPIIITNDEIETYE